MVENYSDHAANERTFLAWVRTAIAVMGFGFLIERFDIFLATMAREVGSRPAADSHSFANIAGFAFIVLGIAMIVIATMRFFRLAREIDKREPVPGSGSLFDLVSPPCSCCLAFRCCSTCRARSCPGFEDESG